MMGYLLVHLAVACAVRLLPVGSGLKGSRKWNMMGSKLALQAHHLGALCVARIRLPLYSRLQPRSLPLLVLSGVIHLCLSSLSAEASCRLDKPKASNQAMPRPGARPALVRLASLDPVLR